MKKAKNNKIKKIIFILILILIIILLIIINIEKNKTLQVPRGNYIGNKDDKYLEERVMPRNIRTLNLYKGNIKRDNFYLKLNDLVEYLLEIKVENNIDKKYFEENKDKVKEFFGNIDFESFKVMANKLNEKDISEFKYAEILENSEISVENGFAFEIKLSFMDNKEINFIVNLIEKSKIEDEKIIFKIVN